MNSHPETGRPEEQAGVQLPRWRCHKEVFADKIKGTRYYASAAKGDDTGMRWETEVGGLIVVTRDLIARGMPAVGDYFVQYLDGYKSWSPAKAFEEGYTRIE